jgi:hypothetical protein
MAKAKARSAASYRRENALLRAQLKKIKKPKAAKRARGQKHQGKAREKYTATTRARLLGKVSKERRVIGKTGTPARGQYDDSI